MKATVCELPDARSEFEHSWDLLVDHVAVERSDLVLLPAMPFSTWFAAAHDADSRVWNEAIRAHDRWEARLKELAPAMVAGTRPIDFGSERHVQAFVWLPEQGFRSINTSSSLRSRPGYREANCHPGSMPEFIPQEVNGVAIGCMLDEEWHDPEKAECYRAEGVQLLLAPRCTDTDRRWLEAARSAAIAAHAHQLSSNRMGSRRFGGAAWIIDPQGNLLATTDRYHPFLTLELEVPWHALPSMESIRHTAQTLGGGGLAML